MNAENLITIEITPDREGLYYCTAEGNRSREVEIVGECVYYSTDQQGFLHIQFFFHIVVFVLT